MTVMTREPTTDNPFAKVLRPGSWCPGPSCLESVMSSPFRSLMPGASQIALTGSLTARPILPVLAPPVLLPGALSGSSISAAPGVSPST